MCDIVELVRSFTITYKKKSALKLVAIPRKMMVQIDSERILLVLKNVIENAFKYSNKNNRTVEEHI